VVLEAARVFAGRLLEKDPDPKSGIEPAFYGIIGRKPDEKESMILDNHMEAFLKEYLEEKSKAEKVLDVGKFPRNQRIPVTNQAALMQVITLIYNMEAAITKA
jgi:hypothetical protein